MASATAVVSMAKYWYYVFTPVLLYTIGFAGYVLSRVSSFQTSASSTIAQRLQALRTMKLKSYNGTK
jgi:hypothetical protein